MRARLHALRRGAVATFLVHVIVTTLATVVAWPLAGLLLRSGVSDPTDLAQLADGLWTGAHGVLTVIDVLLLVLVVAALVAPLVELAWLAALAKRMSLADALALGAKRYFAAWRITLLLAPGLVAALVLLIALPSVAAALLSSMVNERTHDLLVLAATLPAVLLGLVLLAWHDLARAALATSSRTALGAVLRSFGHAIRGRTLVVYIGMAVLALLLGLGGEWLASLLGHAFGAGVIALALTQSLALARTFCRALWLADATIRVAQ